MIHYSRKLHAHFVLLNKKTTNPFKCTFLLNSFFHHKLNLIKYNEEVNNLEDAFIRRISKMNNTALAYTCEEIYKNKINNPHLWELIYNRIKEINRSFTYIELIVMFHAYCNSISFDGNFINLINLFWSLLDNKLNDLDSLSLIALYYCAEKSKNLKIIKEISNLLLKKVQSDWTNVKLNERGLMIIVKIICDHNSKIDNMNRTYDIHIKNICNLILKADIKKVGNILLCMQFFIKYQEFNEPMITIIKKIQSLLIFKKINPYSVLKILSYISNVNNSVALQEIKNTLSIIYLSLNHGV